MEKLILFIFIFVAYSVIKTIKAVMSESNDVKGTPYLGEAFPTIEVPEEESQQPTPTPRTFVSDEMTPNKETYRIKKNKAQAIDKKTEEEPRQKSETTNKGTRRFSLKNKADAKRAFIEAEILNRKY